MTRCATAAVCGPAIETGWVRARQTILIADTVSMLSALILFILAIGSVKGFAFTLGLTTIIDVMVVFMFTKPLMTMLGRTRFFGGATSGPASIPNTSGSRRCPGREPSPGGPSSTDRRPPPDCPESEGI